MSIEVTRRYRGPRASERRQMTASASRQVEDRRLLNETSGKEGSRPSRRRGAPADFHVGFYSGVDPSRGKKNKEEEKNLTRAAKDDDNKAINRSLPASRRSSGSECITSTSPSFTRTRKLLTRVA